MKTAMQELLGLVEQMFTNAKTKEVELAMNDVINIITQVGIEKEKEHLIDAYINGFPDDWESDKRIRYAKEYYNMNYNQNK